MQQQEVVILKRECQATEIPSGKPVILYPGTELRITQSLGGSFTVLTMTGLMVSIAEVAPEIAPPLIKFNVPTRLNITNAANKVNEQLHLSLSFFIDSLFFKLRPRLNKESFIFMQIRPNLLGDKRNKWMHHLK